MGLLDPPSYSRTAADARFGRLGATRAALLPAFSIPSVMSSPPTLASGGSGASPIASAQTIAATSTRVNLLGVLASQVTHTTTYVANTSNGNDVAPGPFSVEFDYYGSDLCVRIWDILGGSLVKMWVWVDGQPATAAPAGPGASGVSLERLRITFASAALRRIRVYMNLCQFGGLEIGPTDTVSAPPRLRPTCAWLGDSFLAGTGATDSLQSVAQTASRLLDFEPYLAGQSGSGYLNDSGGGTKAIFGDAARTAPLISIAPNYLVVWGGINDGSFSDAAVGAAAASLFSTIAAGTPNTKLIVVSNQFPRTPVSAAGASRWAAIRTSALAASNVIGTIDTLTDPWITGTGKVGATASDGNADVFTASDGTHPTQAGHDYYARRLAAAIAGIITA